MQRPTARPTTAGKRRREGRRLEPSRPGARDEKAVERENEAGGVAEQGGVGELRMKDADVPAGEIAGEQEPGGRQHPAEPARVGDRAPAGHHGKGKQ